MSKVFSQNQKKGISNMSDTTTEETFESVAAELQSQPDGSDETTAETTTNEDTSYSDDAGTTEPQEDNSEEAELREWADKKGLDLSDPVAVAKAAREAEKAFHSKSGEVSKLKKAMGDQGKESGESDVEAETYETLNKLKVAEFYQENPDARALDDKMAEILEERPWLAQDLDALYAVAKKESSQTDEAKILAARQEAAREERARIARAQKAGAPNASASSKESPRKYTEADISKMSVAEYRDLVASGFNPYTDVED